MDRRDQLVLATAESQGGVISICQLKAAGHTRASIRHAVRTGRLIEVLPGVYRLPGVKLAWEARLMSAVLWAQDDGCAAGRAAGRLWGWDGYGHAGVEIATTRRKLPKTSRFLVHRYDEELRRDIALVRNIPCTSARRTLLDLLGRKDPRASSALDQALRYGQTSLGELCRFYEEQWTRGRRGVAILRAELMDRDPSLAPTESELENLLWDIIVRFRLPRPERQVPMRLPRSGNIRIDLAYRGCLLAIEGDSYAWHAGKEAFERDRIRDAELQALGWTVLRFTWAQARFDPEYVADTIRGHLRRLGIAA